MQFQPADFALLDAYGDVDLAGGSPVPGVPGVYMKSGVVLNDAMRGFLSAVRQRVGFDLLVTSGTRTPYDQAAAMGQDYNFGVYSQKNLVAELTANGANPRPTVATMAAILQQQVARGQYLSRHMRGDALDFRVRGLSSSERSVLQSTVTSMGVKTLDEGDHLHVENLTSEWSEYLVKSASVGLPIAAAITLSGALVAMAALWVYRDDVRRMVRR